jgi:hypothetical protein
VVSRETVGRGAGGGGAVRSHIVADFPLKLFSEFREATGRVGIGEGGG